MTKATSVAITCIRPDDIQLKIEALGVGDIQFQLTASQLVILIYQAVAVVWSRYKLVPRD